MQNGDVAQIEAGKKEKPQIPEPLENYRHPDLVRRRLTSGWRQTNNLIARHGFPAGFLVSPQVRLWPIAEVERWVAERRAENGKAETGFRRQSCRKSPAAGTPEN